MMKKEYPSDSCAATMVAQFLDRMSGTDFNKGFDDIMGVLDWLPLLRIREGYVLDAFRRGDEWGYTYQAYCHKAGPKKVYILFTPEEERDLCNAPGNLYGMLSVDVSERKAERPYSDNLTIEGLHSGEEVEDIPPALDYFSFPFTWDGILQAWLLDNIHEFMPRFWHAYYGVKTIITGEDSVQTLIQRGPLYEVDKDDRSPELIHAFRTIQDMDISTLLPRVEVDEDTASLSICYWNDWRGLVRYTVQITRTEDSAIFLLPKEEVLVRYKCQVVI